MSQPSEEEPKLIIDEDWKSQVEREKAEFKAKQEADDSSGNDSAGNDSTGSDAAADKGESDAASMASDDVTKSQDQSASDTSGDAVPPPPASLEFLVSSLATQAMASMGQIPGEDGKPLPKNMEYARHFIDLIAVLEEKTQGNLGDDEAQFLQGTLHQMRMIFVQVSQQG